MIIFQKYKFLQVFLGIKENILITYTKITSQSKYYFLIQLGSVNLF